VKAGTSRFAVLTSLFPSSIPRPRHSTEQKAARSLIGGSVSESGLRVAKTFCAQCTGEYFDGSLKGDYFHRMTLHIPLPLG